jgi:hypothetical protein
MEHEAPDAMGTPHDPSEPWSGADADRKVEHG